MGSHIPVPAVVRNRKEKEGTSNQSAREQSLRKKILVLERLVIVSTHYIERTGWFSFLCKSRKESGGEHIL